MPKDGDKYTHKHLSGSFMYANGWLLRIPTYAPGEGEWGKTITAFGYEINEDLFEKVDEQ